jgi:hypothetical protein
MKILKGFALAFVLVLSISSVSVAQMPRGHEYDINTMDHEDFQDIGVGQADSGRLEGYRNIDGAYNNYDELYESGASEETISQLREDSNVNLGSRVIHGQYESFGSPVDYGPATGDTLDDMMYEMR